MKNCVLMILICVFFLTRLSAAGITLDRIKTIGDDREEYTFFKICGAAIGPEKQIYVADSGGFFISQYSWDGRFIRKFGSFGQGPQEFQRISSLKVYKNFLYFNDSSNRRIGKLSLDLTNLEFIPLRKFHLRGSMDVLREDRFLCTFADINNTGGQGKVAVISAAGEMEACFFKTDQSGQEQKPLQDKAWAIKQLTSKILAAVAPNNEEALIAFEYPDNPVSMYLFTLSGEQKAKRELSLPTEYRFAKHLTSYPIQVPKEGVYYPVIRSIMAIQKGFLLHLIYRWDDDKNSKVMKSTLIWLDEKGKKVAEYDVAKDLILFNVTLDGFLVGTCAEDDEPIISVYKINFN